MSRFRWRRLAVAALLSATVLGSTAALANQTSAVQRKLGITADGINGPQTIRAVKRFQAAHGLVVDGIVGPQTLAALGISVRKALVAPGTSAILERIAQCESGGDPTAISSTGMYRGKYQFSFQTWRAMGGKGDPAKASEAEQDRRAAALYAKSGPAPWPVCGR